MCPDDVATATLGPQPDLAHPIEGINVLVGSKLVKPTTTTERNKNRYRHFYLGLIEATEHRSKPGARKLVSPV